MPGWLLRGSWWRREVRRASPWLIPAAEVAAAVVLFIGTCALDQAAYDGDVQVAGWPFSSPDVARTVLTVIAATVITVIGVAYSIVIAALTLTPAPFGSRLLRNVIRHRGTQLALGTYLATFAYAVLTLGSVGEGGHGSFVPHISVTVTLVLMLADLAVLVWFPHHIAVQIRLPQVIAGIAGDLHNAIDLRADDPSAGADARMAALLIAGLGGEGGVVEAPRSGYLRFSQHETLVRIAAKAGAVVHVRHRPGHFVAEGAEYGTVWPAEAASRVAQELSRAHITGPYRMPAQDVSFGLDQLAEMCIRALSTAANDTLAALACIDRIADGLCKVAGGWQPTQVYRDSSGAVRVIATGVSWERLVQRAFAGVRQAGRARPAVLIRQLDALARIMERTTMAPDRQVLLDQAAMIARLSAGVVAEPGDRADISRAYQRVVSISEAPAVAAS